MTKLNLNNFLKENGVNVNNEEAAQLMFRLDADNDDRISYEEFKEIFYPIKEDFVYTPKDDVSHSNNYNKKYEKKSKYNFISNNTNEKDYDYNNNDYDNIDNKSDKDYNSDNDNDYNEKSDRGKKGKKTKKVILKKADDSSNVVRSQDQNNNSLKNYQRESYSKYPNINNHNSTDNYTLNKNNKYNKNINYKNTETEDNNYNSKITQKSLIMNESNNKNSNEIDDNDPNNNYNSYESKRILRVKNNKNIYSSNNNYNNNDDDDHDNKRIGCKGCLYMAKNIYNNYREKNSKSNPFKSFEKQNYSNYSNNIQKKERNNIKANNLNNYSNLNNQERDIYKRKNELLKKYGNYTNDYNNNLKNNDKDDNLFNSEENFSTNINKNNLNDNNNDDDDNEKENNNYISQTKKDNNSINVNRFQKTKDTTSIKENIYEKRKLLFKLFQNFIEQDNKLEKIKESLASCPDASFSKIFSKFNQNKKNLIFSSDLYDVLNSFSSSEINFTPNDIKYILKKYNKSIESGFNYNEFCNIISPKKITSKIIIEKRDKSNTVDEEKELNEETKNAIVDFFGQLIEGEKSSEEIRTMINMSDDNICNDLFGGIKKENKPGIEKDDIDKFMRENGYNIKDNEILIIMEKMDKNKDDIIDYGEFISEITPKIL
jgi:Ca2+-binding EF-hand superfamily protein